MKPHFVRTSILALLTLAATAPAAEFVFRDFVPGQEWQLFLNTDNEPTGWGPGYDLIVRYQKDEPASLPHWTNWHEFAKCMDEPVSGCEVWDLDADWDVDLADYAVYQRFKDHIPSVQQGDRLVYVHSPLVDGLTTTPKRCGGWGPVMGISVWWVDLVVRYEQDGAADEYYRLHVRVPDSLVPGEVSGMVQYYDEDKWVATKAVLR